MPTRHAVLPVPVDSLIPAVVNDPAAPGVGDFERLSVPSSHVLPGVTWSTPSAGGVDLEPVDDVVSEPADAAALVLEERFSIVPEWVLDADVSDAAVRLYAVLLRYGQSSGQRMPSRRTLAARLRKRSVDSVDRALKELVALGAVEVTRRSRGGLSLTNRYLVRSTRPGRRHPDPGGGRTDAATPSTGASTRRPGHLRERGCGRGSGRMVAAGGGRRVAAGVAARLRPDPECLTENQPPPPPSSTPTPTPSPAPVTLPVAPPMTVGRGAVRKPGPRDERRSRVLAVLGLDDLTQVAARCVAARRDCGRPAGLWTVDRLLDVLAGAVLDDGWPAAAAVPALLVVAADPATRSPARLRQPGPWWDATNLAGGVSVSSAGDAADLDDLDELDAVLVEVGGLRVGLQRQARAELAAEGTALTRATVVRRAVELLHRRQP